MQVRSEERYNKYLCTLQTYLCRMCAPITFLFGQKTIWKKELSNIYNLKWYKEKQFAMKLQSMN